MVIKIKVVYLHHQTRTTGAFSRKIESETMNTQSIYNGLDYTTKEINRNFKIKVNGIVNGKKVNVLVGVSGLIKIVGDIYRNVYIERVKDNPRRNEVTPGVGTQ